MSITFSAVELDFIREAVNHYTAGEDVNSSPHVLRVLDKLNPPKKQPDVRTGPCFGDVPGCDCRLIFQVCRVREAI